MGHGTASGRTGQTARPQRSIAEVLGTTPERVTERSQLAIQMLKPTNRIGDIREITVGSVERNKLYSVTMFKDALAGRGYVASVRDNAEDRDVIFYEHYDSLVKAKDAVYKATGIPKPSRRS